MKNLIILVIATLLTSITASAHCGKLEGSWTTQNIAGDVTYTTTLTFNDHTVTATQECSQADQSVSVKVRSRATYTDVTITTLDTHKSQKALGKIKCEISLNAETASYSILGNFVMINGLQSTIPLILMKL